jgi:hypothetical protein
MQSKHGTGGWTMNDLISREALLNEMELDEPDSADENNPEIKGMRLEWKHWKKKIKRFPAVDAVEVVRCKNCIHWKPSDAFGGNSIEDLQRLGGCKWSVGCRKENDFCSGGERKENETD